MDKKEIIKTLGEHFSELTIEIEITDKEGQTHIHKLNDPDDFFNETVPKGTTVNLVLTNGEVLHGQNGGVDDRDDGFELFLYATGKALGVSIPMNKILGWYGREEILRHGSEDAQGSTGR